MEFGWLAGEIGASTRRIRRRPGACVHICLILALAVGCTIGIFHVAHGILRAPLPCPDPDRVVVAEGSTRRLLFAYNLPNPHLDTVFEKAAEYQLLDANWELGQGSRRVQLALVSPRFFATLGVSIRTGRDFSETDYYPIPGSQPDLLPIIISDGLWRTYLASNDSVINKRLELNVPPYHFQVLGVAPPEATFPEGVDGWTPVHLTSYWMFQTAGVPAYSGGVIGLLKPGLSRAAAEAGIRAWPKERLFGSGRDGAVRLVSLRDFRAGEVYPLSLRLSLASLAFLVLAITAAVTTFQTGAEGRREEFAVRSALGASPSRLITSVGLETGLVVLLASAASLPIKSVLVRATVARLSLPKGFGSGAGWLDLAMAGGVGGIVFAASLVAQVAGLSRCLPLFSGFGQLRRELARGHSTPRTGARHRVPVQVVSATMILIVAALLLRSAHRIMHIDPGVRPAGTFVCEVSLPSDVGRFQAGMKPKASGAGPEEAPLERYREFHKTVTRDTAEIENSLRGRPGVLCVGAISTAPYRGHGPLTFNAQFSPVPDMSAPAKTINSVAMRAMSPEAIPALGMGPLYGRNFSGHAAEDENTVVVNQALAGHLGGASAALGQYLKVVALPPARIVGVVGNVREKSLISQVWPTAYFPFSQYAVPDLDLVVRTSSDIPSRDVLEMIQASVSSVSPVATVSHFERLSGMVESAATLTLYSAYFLLALAVLSVFVAGVCAFSKTLAEVYRRKREIGIRMALGGTPADIIALLVGSDLKRAAIASLLGALLAWWFSRLLGTLLVDVNAFDPIGYFFAVATLLTSTSIVQVLLLKRVLKGNPRDLM